MMLKDFSPGVPSCFAICAIVLASALILSLASGNSWFHTRMALSTSRHKGARTVACRCVQLAVSTRVPAILCICR